MKILSVVSVTVDKQYGYGYLKEIVVRRADQKLYTFMEDDFPRLHLNDIEDMLLLLFQNKIFNLEGNVIVDLAVALRMYTHRIVGYNKAMDRRKWTETDKRRTRIMIKQIDEQMLERRIMKSLEKFVGGREYGTDVRLLQQTI
ncbi:hypothetical protein Tco_1418130 [Tanacetum coccineum]